MSYDLSNEKGAYWKASNRLWSAILRSAHENGWEPSGTVMYERGGLHPDMMAYRASELPTGVFIADSLDESQVAPDQDELTIIIETTLGDIALGFEQATKSGEIDPDWDGSYVGNDGQIISSDDAANMATGLRRSIEAGEWGENADYIQELIDLLDAGEVRIT